MIAAVRLIDVVKQGNGILVEGAAMSFRNRLGFYEHVALRTEDNKAGFCHRVASP